MHKLSLERPLCFYHRPQYLLLTHKLLSVSDTPLKQILKVLLIILEFHSNLCAGTCHDGNMTEKLQKKNPKKLLN